MCQKARSNSGEVTAVKKLLVTKEVITKAARESTRASARLENRVVPTNFERSPQVEKYLESRRKKA
jgi:hypothetical protein